MWRMSDEYSVTRALRLWAIENERRLEEMMAFSRTSDSTLQLGILVGRIACIIFVLEAAIMLALSGFQLQTEVVATSLLDAGLLTVLASPVIYAWVARPFADEATAARAELRAQLEETRQLLAQNEALRGSLQEFSEVNASIQERALQRVGSDLHDGPAQSLTFTLVQLDRLTRRIELATGAISKQELEELRGVVADALKEIKILSRGLVLPELGSLTLTEVVRLAAQRHRQATGVDVKIEIIGVGGATLALRSCIYRVVQEALANACKHGQADNVTVKVEHDPALTVTITDDGRGFDPLAAGPRGLGLSGMRARIQALGGQFRITSSHGRGTAVSARFDRPIPLASGAPHG